MCGELHQFITGLTGTPCLRIFNNAKKWSVYFLSLLSMTVLHLLTLLILAPFSFNL
jgi:hypothetical protein